jgi:ABC-type nitrate/sulfonate/bicarbonate transport system substrate-binding protein
MTRPIETPRLTRRTAMLMGLGTAAVSRPSAAQGRSISIGYQEQPDWLMFVARDQRLFEKLGLSPNFVKFPGGTPMIEAARDGVIDIASCGAIALLLGISQGLDWEVIGVNPEGPYSQGLVARKDADIHRPADLRGKRVGVYKGSTAQFGLLMLMRQHGLQRHSLTTVFLTPEEQVAGLKDGRLDAAMVWEPWMQRMIHGLGARLITTEGDLGVHTNVDGYTVRRSWLQANRPTAVRFITALLMAHDAIRKDPSIAVRGWAADMAIKKSWAETVYENVPPPLIHEWTNPRYSFALVKDSALYRSLNYLAEFMLEEKLISQPVETDDILDPSVVTEALRGYRPAR